MKLKKATRGSVTSFSATGIELAARAEGLSRKARRKVVRDFARGYAAALAECAGTRQEHDARAPRARAPDEAGGDPNRGGPQ